MPNKENIRKWVEALRSGNYPQTTSTLADSDGYCCLGVACEISGLGRWGDDADAEFDYTPSTYVVELDDGAVAQSDGDLPKPVADWLGFDSSNPVIADEASCGDEDCGNHKVTAISANDDACWDFAQIADAVEVKYLQDA